MLFFLWNGARNSSIVGAAFCLGFEDSEICRLIEGLKNAIEDLCRFAFAHDEHTQAASLQPSRDSKLGNLFIVLIVVGGSLAEPRMITTAESG